jgi:hypothetical protein
MSYGLLSGLVLIIASFAYELLFNNIPYPDPTPEMAARWEFQETVANKSLPRGPDIDLCEHRSHCNPKGERRDALNLPPV